MKKILLLLCLALGTSAALQAQRLVFQAGGGLSSHYGSSSRNIGAFKIGAGVEFELSQTLTVEPALLYFAKGWKNKDQTVFLYDDNGDILLDKDGNKRTGKMNVTSNANYIVLPVVFNYFIRLSSPHYIVLSAGPYAAYGIGGKTKTKGDTSQEDHKKRYYYDQSTFKMDGVHRFDAGITAGVGYEFNHIFDAGVEVDCGMLNVKKDGGKNLSLLLSFRYRIGM